MKPRGNLAELSPEDGRSVVYVYRERMEQLMRAHEARELDSDSSASTSDKEGSDRIFFDDR